MAIARAKAAAAAKAAAEKAAAEKAAALAAAEARAAAAERARLQAQAKAAAQAAAAAAERKAAADRLAAQNAARLAKKRFDDEQAQLRAAAAAAKAQAAAAKAQRAHKTALAANRAAHAPAKTVYYPNCVAVIAAGAAPLHKGSPGYRKALDSNANGIACEYLHKSTSSSGGSSGGSSPAASPPAVPSGSGGWTAAKGEAAVAAAERWVGTPYSWGGGNSVGPTTGICGPNGAENDCNVVGFDCSGLTSYGWAQEGISIPNYSVYQYTLGQHISISDLLPGDLLFYANDTSDPSTIHHVTMYAGNGMMVEAPFSGAYVHITSADFGNGYIGVTRVGT